jgi:protein TonB
MFDMTLMASKHRRDAGRTLAVLPLALAAHALALGVVMVGQLWAVDPVQECALVPPLIVHLPPRLGGGGEGREKVRAARKVPTTHVARQQLVQPAVVPADRPRTTDPERSADVPRVPGSERLGSGENTGPGIGDGPTRPGVDTAHPAEPPRRIGGDIEAPVAIARWAPKYPEYARKMRVEGVVVVEAVIDESGNVVRARFLNDIGMGCGDAAVEAIRTWKYKPATLDGRPVSVYLEVKVSFRLQGVE